MMETRRLGSLLEDHQEMAKAFCRCGFEPSYPVAEAGHAVADCLGKHAARACRMRQSAFRMAKVIPFSALAMADLVIHAIYEGAR
jgi:hypothetical protein